MLSLIKPKSHPTASPYALDTLSYTKAKLLNISLTYSLVLKFITRKSNFQLLVHCEKRGKCILPDSSLIDKVVRILKRNRGANLKLLSIQVN